jgi:hypothetical protein
VRFQSPDWLFGHLIEAFGRVDDQKRKVNFAKDFPALWNETSLFVHHSCSVVEFQLDVFQAFLLRFDFKWLVGFDCLGCSVGFGRDCA